MAPRPGYGTDMVFTVGEPRLLWQREPSVDVWRGVEAGRRLGRKARLVFLDGAPAYELSFPCGTCQFLFRRMEGSNDTLPVEELRERLAVGLEEIDEHVVTSFGQLLERGTYLPLLLTVQPRLVAPAQPGDYFAEEQLSTWGVDSFWGLPEYPRTAYYRTFETNVSGDGHLYEFLVPMLPPAWDDRTRVADYGERLADSSASTAVAVTTLDICAPAGSDWHEHWGLTHFLLDGHHKMHAAAETERPVRLLSLLSVESSLAAPEQVARLATLRRQPRHARKQAASRR